MADQVSTVKYDETATVWHLMVRTYGGEVSMLQNMDAPTARQAYQRLKPDTRPVEYINMPEFGRCGEGRIISDRDIMSVDILGPEGAKLEPWRGVEALIIDLAPQREQQERRKKAAEVERNALASLKTKDDVIQAWFERKVAQYDGASVTLSELYDDVTGSTLKSFANQHAPDGVDISEKYLGRWLDRKGIRSRGAMFAKRYDGIRHVSYGDVRYGNYGT
ncbi:hypothetical protein INR77_08925 [Erythrobacter sp. SCSIO 43205]|uniref:hypothetical protein n=1 Tax=Erythrobacter sp. SCSIO 43205 TaxID=2779361 RepID=UPI001CA8CDAC|nr:hypothetical protein [Erythrobacter sp. SCSIO 43205]UAB76970.1 hypothetical protein INR77_08925 [Erythrobacter sp. SCSIO 43205]